MRQLTSADDADGVGYIAESVSPTNFRKNQRQD